MRTRLERAQSTCGSVADQSEYARSEAGRSVASTMRRNVETFFGEILEKDERDALKVALEHFRKEKADKKSAAGAKARRVLADAASEMDDVV